MAASTEMTKMVRVLRNGRITIPVEFRRMLPIDEDSMFQVTLVDGGLIVKPVHVREKGNKTVAQTLQVDTRLD